MEGYAKSRKEAKENGLTEYFTGKPCKNGNTEIRTVAKGHCQCAECKKQVSDYNKAYYQADIENQRERGRIYHHDNIEKCRARNNEYGKNNRDKINARTRERYEENPEAVRAPRRVYWHSVLKSDPNNIASRACGRMLRRILEKTDRIKETRTEKMLGFTKEEFIKHIEKQFTPGMSWDKVGSEVHIDHIVPVSHFISIGEHRPEVINALSNLRPMWAKENRAKSNKITFLL